MAENPVDRISETAIQPRAELTAALRRCQQGLTFYAPELKNFSITELYEYAAGRLLRDYVPCPQRIVRDLQLHQADRTAWWEQWRNPER